MAPGLPFSKLKIIRDMLLSKSLTRSQMAEALNVVSLQLSIFAAILGNLEMSQHPLLDDEA
jgi:hypothetical protein